MGRRISKTNNQQQTTNYVLDKDRVIEERDGNNTLLATYTHGNGIDEILTMERNSHTYYYHENTLGSIYAVTNETGNVVERYAYDPYGKPSFFDGSSTPISNSLISNNYLFTGREFDPETGLYYYRARYYIPTLGRFLQRDPIGYLGGINLYAYCKNNPVDYTDPYGLEEARISFLEGEEFQQAQQGNVGAEARPAGPDDGPDAEVLGGVLDEDKLLIKDEQEDDEKNDYSKAYPDTEPVDFTNTELNKAARDPEKKQLERKRKLDAENRAAIDKNPDKDPSKITRGIYGGELNKLLKNFLINNSEVGNVIIFFAPSLILTAEANGWLKGNGIKDNISGSYSRSFKLGGGWSGKGTLDMSMPTEKNPSPTNKPEYGGKLEVTYKY